MKTSLMAIDYSQIELRKAADESQDPVMLRIFNTGGDMHMETACAMFGLPPDQIDDKRHRRPAKTVNFGVIYGISAPTLLTKFYHEDILGFSEDDCRAFIDSWRNLYAGYFQWAEEVKGFALRNGYVVDMFGRRRYVPEVYSSIRGIRESGFREAVNAPIQSGAGGILKEAMCQLIPAYREWQLLGYIVRPLLQVHDELIFEVEDDILPMAAPQFKQIMESVVVLSVPLIADVKTGTDWGHMTKWEE